MAKKIIIADDHSLTRMGMSMICHDVFNEVIILECSSIADVIRNLQSHSDVDLMLLDNFFGDVSSIQYLELFKSDHYLPKTLMISLGNDDVFALRALKEGAKGYINKMAPFDEVKKAIKDVVLGDLYLPPRLLRQYIMLVSEDNDSERSPFENLSGREFQIALYLIRGMELKEIAIVMNLKPTTISTYKSRIFEKIGVSRQKDLWALGVQFGLDD